MRRIFFTLGEPLGKLKLVAKQLEKTFVSIYNIEH